MVNLQETINEIQMETDKIDNMHEDMREVFHRLKEVELAVVELKPRR